jgi:hypothetical protein
MSYNGSGTFQINTSGQPVVTGTVISSSAFNALTADLATGLSTAITKDGQTATTVRIPFAQGINSSLTTDATNTTTGSIITAGGVGIAKALFVGTTTNIAGLTASKPLFTDASKNLVSTGTLGADQGGTGIENNAASTITISGNFASTFTVGGAYNYTFPSASDTLVNLGSSQTLTSKTLTNPTVTNYVESVVAIGTVTTSSTIALTSGTVQTATLTASTACTFTMPTATAGKSFVLLLKQAASTGNGTATFTGVKWGTAGAPTITATAGKMDILTFIADGTNWYGSAAQGYTP